MCLTPSTGWARIVCCLTPNHGEVVFLIDPAQPDHPVATLHAATRRGEGMTDSPTRACPPSRSNHGTGADEHQPASRPTGTAPTPTPLLRAEQLPPARRGPPGPTAASRSASGRSWTPTPRWRSPIDRRRKRKRPHERPSSPLTGPTPSGMTQRGARSVYFGGRVVRPVMSRAGWQSRRGRP